MASNQQSPPSVQSCRGSPQALEQLQVDTWQASDPSRSCCQRVQGADLALDQALQLPDLLPTALECQLEVRVWHTSCAAGPRDCCSVVAAPAGDLQRRSKACCSTRAITAAARPWNIFVEATVTRSCFGLPSLALPQGWLRRLWQLSHSAWRSSLTEFATLAESKHDNITCRPQ